MVNGLTLGGFRMLPYCNACSCFSASEISRLRGPCIGAVGQVFRYLLGLVS